MEKKGRKGKGVTMISGVSMDEGELRKIGTFLKKKCSAGGTVKGGVIEIQGDHRATVIKELEKKGYVVKHVGG